MPIFLSVKRYHIDNTSSWGGSIIQGDDGVFYMWAAEMVEHCGLGAWTRNSRIILASSNHVEGNTVTSHFLHLS